MPSYLENFEKLRTIRPRYYHLLCMAEADHHGLLPAQVLEAKTERNIRQCRCLRN